MKEAHVCDDDVFNAAAVRNARAVDDKLRELAPVVKLSRENISMIGRHEHVAAGLRD
jgi:4-methoxybenzoate monooxygenase (O-demethylating)